MKKNSYFLRPTNKVTKLDAEWHPFMLWETDEVCAAGEEVLDDETGRFYVVEEWADHRQSDPEKAIASIVARDRQN